MAVSQILCTCDWCEKQESFNEDEEEFEGGWWVILCPPDGEASAYCSFECLVADQS
jgi:hypothetical protein